MSSKNISLEEKTLYKNWEKYRGYIVMVVNDKIFAAKRGSTAKKYFNKILKQYHKVPLTTVIPKNDALILFI